MNCSLSLRRKTISEIGLVRMEGLLFLEGTERITVCTRPSLLDLTSETRAMGQLLRLGFLSFMMIMSPGVRDRWIWVHLGLGWRESIWTRIGRPGIEHACNVAAHKLGYLSH